MKPWIKNTIDGHVNVGMKRRQFLKKCAGITLWGGVFGGGSLLFSRRADAKKTGKRFEPAYLKLHKSGELKKRGQKLWNKMESCSLCPRTCGAQRLKGEEGFCHASSKLEVYSAHPHHGEERPLSGRKGSGTIFLSNCNLRCVFCINWEINHDGMGWKRSIDALANMMIKMQKMGCHNINIVTPTHYSAHIVLAVDKAAAMGLRLPLVYNTSGWERKEILDILEGIVDIYLPDFKYWDGKMSDRYSSGAASYPEVCKKALLEMNRQVGTAHPAANGLMERGLMIRHLVLPNDVSGSVQIMEWIGGHLPKDTYVNIMSQYRPAYKASKFPKLSRRITRSEYMDVVTAARKAGLNNLDIQGYRG